MGRGGIWLLAMCRERAGVSGLFLVLSFVRGGHVYLDTGSLRNAGLNNYYWSATTYPNATNTYFLHSNSTNVYPSYYINRFYGFSVHQITILTNNTAASPLYYVRGGYVALDTGSLRYAGVGSSYWSATTYTSATGAYYLDFDSTSVVPSNYNHRFYGFSVR